VILAIVVGAIRFDPTAMVGAIAAVIGGMVVFRHFETNHGRNKSRRSTQKRVDQQDASSGSGRGRSRVERAHLKSAMTNLLADMELAGGIAERSEAVDARITPA